MGRFFEKYINPFVLPLGLLALILVVLAAVGELYLALFVPGDTPDRRARRHA